MEQNSRDQTSFWQFSDQLRLHTSNLANLSLGDTIWADHRRNVDPTSASAGAGATSADGWKLNNTTQKLAFGYNNNLERHNNVNPNDLSVAKGGNFNGNGPMMKNNYLNKAVAKPAMSNGFGSNRRNLNNNDPISSGKKKIGNDKHSNNNNNNNNNGNGAVDKRFKTLPPSEALPRNEAVGGYIFVCNNDTMQENLKRQLFGLPPRYRDSVRAITPGLPLFLYNYSTHQLHGIFEAASFGGTNIDPMAWEDKKSQGESRFPAQVKVVTRKICDPLEEDSFRPILHHYDGPKFRLELSVPEALALLDIFAETNA